MPQNVTNNLQEQLNTQLQGKHRVSSVNTLHVFFIHQKEPQFKFAFSLMVINIIVIMTNGIVMDGLSESVECSLFGIKLYANCW